MKYRLGDLCCIVSGSTPKTNVLEYWGGNLKWVTPAELSDDSYIINDTVRKITELGVSKTALNSFPAGTVLLSSRAPIGKVAIAGCDMYCNQGFKNLICSSKIYNKYLFWFLKSKTDFLNLLGRGATFKEISKQIVSDIEIELPDFEKQVKVANIFEKISHLIYLRNQQLEQLDLLIKSRFVEMFGDPYYNSKKWVTKPFLELGDCKNGMNFNSQETGIRIRYVGVGDFQNRVFITDKNDLPFVSLNEMPKEEYLLKNEDILFVRSNGSKELVGRCVVVCPNNEPITYSGFCIRWRKKTEKVLIPFIIYLLKHDSTRLLFSGRGANIQNINQKMLQELNIIIPPLALQTQFATFVEEVEKEKTTVKQSLEWLNTLKSKLMQDYFG